MKKNSILKLYFDAGINSLIYSVTYLYPSYDEIYNILLKLGCLCLDLSPLNNGS